MAIESVSVTAGTGTKIAVDTVDTDKQVQYVKLMDGTDGSATVLVGGAAGLKVDLTSTGANTNKILVTPDLPTGAATAAKQLADGHNVVVTSITASALPTGASTAAKQPALGTAGTASADVITVQGVASMTPILATASIAAAQTLATVTNLSQLGGVAIDMGTGTRGAGTQRVTIATNDAVPVTFTGSTDAATQTTLAAINTKLASGTVIGDVNLGATDNAVLDSIVTNTNRVAITGYFQAKLDHADVTTAQVLIAAVADKKFYITSLIFSAAAAGAYWIEDDDTAQITCKWTLAANGGVSWSCPIDTPFKSTTANKGLKVKGSAAGVIGCMITGYQLA